jgi:uncharacterized protein (TIGR03086 family)
VDRAAIDRHRRACAGFQRAVALADANGAWAAPSPCTEWDARGVLEHVIGFHEVLLLRPAGVRAHRPRDIPVGRWEATERAIFTVLELGDAVPPEIPGLLPALTTDVLVHTWDLARATGGDETLDQELCALAEAATVANADMYSASGMFDAPVPVDAGADVQTRLLARLGRRP